MQCSHCIHLNQNSSVRIEQYNFIFAIFVDGFFRHYEGKHIASKEQTRELCFGRLGHRAINSVIGVHYITVFRWLADTAGNLPESRPEIEASSLYRS